MFDLQDTLVLHLPAVVASESFSSTAEHFCITIMQRGSLVGAVKLPMAVLKTAISSQVCTLTLQLILCISLM